MTNLDTPKSIGIRNIDDLKKFLVNDLDIWDVTVSITLSQFQDEAWTNIKDVCKYFQGSSMDLRLNRLMLKDILLGLGAYENKSWLGLIDKEPGRIQVCDDEYTDVIFELSLESLLWDSEFVEKMNEKLAKLTKSDGSELQDLESKEKCNQIIGTRDTKNFEV